jgi:DNA-3-methyladenine glycosylase II
MARKRQPKDPWARAVEHLRKLDTRWSDLIDRVGPCILRPRPDRFGTLVRAIIGQQISSRAAASIDAKLRALAGELHTPGPLLALGEEKLRTAGISGVKARYILNLAEAVASGRVPVDEFHDWDDEAIVASLTSIKGIGVWTAEMFLIFALNRPDVLPVGDLGVRVAIRDRHGLDELPRPQLCRELAEPWRPYRSIAIWYLWRGFDTPVRAESDAAVEGGGTADS